jgi:hypothetical protein
MAECGTRLVRFFQILNLFLSQLNFGGRWKHSVSGAKHALMLRDCTDQILKVLHAGGANDRRRDTVLAHTPSDRNLRHADPTLLGNLFHASSINQRGE